MSDARPTAGTDPSAGATLVAERIEDLAEALRAAQADGTRVLPCGRRSRRLRHAPAAAPQQWLSTAGLQGVRWIDIADQTCEVEAGLPPAALEALLRPHRLTLGALSPCAGAGTLGGLFLAPDISLLHAVCGPPRDQVLGAEWLLADGTRVRSGARVVKSVAGYDVTRLFLGSRGRLAVCTALTLRLRPLPRRVAWYQCATPRHWREAGGAPARLAVQPAPERPLYLQYSDGDAPPDGLAERIEDRVGEHALAETLAAFEHAPRRCASERVPHSAPCGAADWNALQFALPDDGPAPDGATVVPFPADDPWLERVARACTPDARPLGS